LVDQKTSKSSFYTRKSVQKKNEKFDTRKITPGGSEERRCDREQCRVAKQPPRQQKQKKNSINWA
jgi:hypothetical protein